MPCDRLNNFAETKTSVFFGSVLIKMDMVHPYFFKNKTPIGTFSYGVSNLAVLFSVNKKAFAFRERTLMAHNRNTKAFQCSQRAKGVA